MGSFLVSGGGRSQILRKKGPEVFGRPLAEGSFKYYVRSVGGGGQVKIFKN